MGGGPPEGTDDPFVSETERTDMVTSYNERFSDGPEMEENVESDGQTAEEATADQIDVSKRLETITDSNMLNGSLNESFGAPIDSPYSTPAPSGEFNSHETDEHSPPLAALQTQYAPIQDSTFEDNLSYEQSIMKSEAEKNPFVGQLESIEELMREYEHGSDSYRQKIQKLAEKHGKIRRCRGDGNCFYRALAFAWFERLLHSRSHHLIQKALDTIKSTSDLLISASFQPEVIEDFYEGVYQLLQSISKGMSDESLWSMFQIDMTSNCIVWYFRAVTSAFLKKNREEFEPFLEVEMDMDQYCGKFVEVMDKEADHIHVTVLTKALQIPVEIAYLSGSNALEEVNFHEFYPELEENNGVPTVPLKPLVLLYRPGHYDILYRNE